MKNQISLFFIALAILAGVHQVAAQGTVLTYQGRLTDAGSPANGTNYGMLFYLYDAPTNGGFQGQVQLPSVTVSNGVFTVPLDFGNVFDGNPRWLQIYVQKNNGGFTALSPRQPLTPSPYAVFANTASNLVGSVPIGALPPNLATTNFVGTNFVAKNNGVATNLAVKGTFSVNGSSTAVASENLRIVRGFVAYDGTIESGAGFTVVSNSPGFYTITFNPSFGDYPAVTGMGGSSMSYNVLGYDKVLIGVYLLGGVPPAMIPEPVTFSFIAIGQQ
jgi:hypothetical protein